MSQTTPGLFYPLSALHIIVTQWEEALNAMFLQRRHEQCF